MSRIALGTGYFGTRTGRAEAGRMVDRFLDAGGDLVDTADVYGRGVLRAGIADAGASESTLGAILAGRRDRVVLATKVGQRAVAGSGADKVGLSRAMIERSVDASLRRLRTDRIDLYQCHLADPQTPIEETLGALTDLVSAGKIRHIGVSNWDGWQVVDAARISEVRSTAAVVSDQVFYNVVDRGVETSVIPACRRVGVGIMAYSPLAGGFLLGGYRRSEARPAAGNRLVAPGQILTTSWDGLATDRGWTVLETVESLARDLGVPPSLVGLRWLLEAGQADVVVVGPRDDPQLAEFVRAGDASIGVDALAELTRVSAPQATYPASFTDAFGRSESPLYGGLPDLGHGPDD